MRQFLIGVTVLSATVPLHPAAGSNGAYEVWAIDQSNSPAGPSAGPCTSGTATRSKTGTRLRTRPRNGSISAVRPRTCAWRQPGRCRCGRT